MSTDSLPGNRIVVVLAIVLVMLIALLVGSAVVQTGGGSAVGGGKALIGGPFTLVDHNGETRADKDLRGQNLLIYFSFSLCPDVCPTELAKIAATADMLPEEIAARVREVL